MKNTKQFVIPDENPSGHQIINKARRSFSKAGVIMPIIITLTSQPVFGVQCLSNKMSGNLSQPTLGFNCWGGMSPGFWMTPHGRPALSTLRGEDWQWAWNRTGYSYGTSSQSHPNQWSDYTGGTDIQNADMHFFIKDFTIPNDWDTDHDGIVSIREALNQGNNSSGLHTIICGWLNMKYFKSFGNPADNYFIMNETDFMKLYNSNPGLLLSLISQYEDLTPNNQV